MTRSDLYKAILPKLADFLLSAGIITAVDRDNIDDEISLTHYEDASMQLVSLPSTVAFKKIAQYIHDGLSDSSEIMDVLPVRHKTAAEENRGRLKPFSYKRADLAILPVVTINKEVKNTSVVDLDSRCGKILDLIWLENINNIAELNYLWECCLGQHEHDFYLLTSEPTSVEGDWRLYSYGYLCFVNEDRFERPSELNYTGSNPFMAAIPYNSANKYEQYFDAYNVMSESKYADDVLLRYLRMYQILEYFGYRRILAGMTKGNIRENGFVRNLISKVGGRSNNELTEIKSGVSDLLPHLATRPPQTGLLVSTDITPQMEAFIKDKLLLSAYSFCDDQLWNVIYKLRNSIVHNKESEFHFTYSNTDVYIQGIELMKLFIHKLEPEIVKIINDPAVTGLEFANQKVQVY